MLSLRSKPGGSPRRFPWQVDDLRTTSYAVPGSTAWDKHTHVRTPRERRRAALADVAYIVLRTSGWLAGNLLGILGCAVAAFVVISHGDIDTFFLHVDNLAARYVAADLGRRAVFAHQLVQLFGIVFAATMLVRGPAFVARLRRDLAEKIA